MKIPKDMEVGCIHETKKNGKLEIVSYQSCNDVTVRFLNTGFITKSGTSTIRSGNVKDHYKPIVYGVGFFGVGKYRATIKGKDTKVYKTWHGMMERCYSAKWHKSKPTYIGCKVCEKWHNFQVFAEWFEENYIDGYQLDKDHLSGSNIGKLYSPETCKFVSLRDNVEHSQAGTYKYISPDGEIVTIFNLSRFCEYNNLSQSHMTQVRKGDRNHHKGWTAFNQKSRNPSTQS